MLGYAPQDRTWTRLAPRLHTYLLAIADCGSIVCLSWVYRAPIRGLSYTYRVPITGLSWVYRTPIVYLSRDISPERLRRSSKPLPSSSAFRPLPKPLWSTPHYGPSRAFGARLVVSKKPHHIKGTSKNRNVAIYLIPHFGPILGNLHTHGELSFEPTYTHGELSFEPTYTHGVSLPNIYTHARGVTAGIMIFGPGGFRKLDGF